MAPAVSNSASPGGRQRLTIIFSLFLFIQRFPSHVLLCMRSRRYCSGLRQAAGVIQSGEPARPDRSRAPLPRRRLRETTTRHLQTDAIERQEVQRSQSRRGEAEKAEKGKPEKAGSKGVRGHFFGALFETRFFVSSPFLLSLLFLAPSLFLLLLFALSASFSRADCPYLNSPVQPSSAVHIRQRHPAWERTLGRFVL